MIDVQVGDIATMRKPHPCGSVKWKVFRIGADIGVRCLGCERRQMMPRSKFEKAVKKLERSEADDQQHS